MKFHGLCLHKQFLPFPAPFILWDSVLKEVEVLTANVQLSTEASQLLSNADVLRAVFSEKAECSYSKQPHSGAEVVLGSLLQAQY